MSTFQATESLLPAATPNPSRIPVRSQRCPDVPTAEPRSLDKENHDPRRLLQKPLLSASRPLVDAAGSRWKASHQTEKPPRLVVATRLRNPLEELKPSLEEQNIQHEPSTRTDASGAIEFVADPAALATILSGEGVKSYPLGHRSSLAQRVLVRGSKGGTMRRGQSARASAYLAPRTPIHPPNPARSSCFSRIEGPGPHGRTLGLRGTGTVIPPVGPSSTHLSLEELRRETCGNSRTKVSHASRLLLETPVKPASLLPEGEHEVASHSDVGGGALLGLVQQASLRETQEIIQTRVELDPLGMKDSGVSHLMPSPAPVAQPMFGRVVTPSVTHPSPFGKAQRVTTSGLPAATSYSLLRRLAIQPKAQFTPIHSAPKVQKKSQCLNGLSPQSYQEEPALPWLASDFLSSCLSLLRAGIQEQIAVRLFDQDSCMRLQEEAGKPPGTSASEPHPNKTLTRQELRMQRINMLQQLLRQEIEGLAVDKCSFDGGSSLDMLELQPMLAEISGTLNTPRHDSDTSHLPGLSKHPGLADPCLVEECAKPQPCPGLEAEVAQACFPTDPGPPEPEPCCRAGPQPSSQAQSDPCPPAQPEPLQPSPQRYARSPEVCPKVELRASAVRSLKPSSPESSPQHCCNQGPPATTSLTFSSQNPLCASPAIHSLQSLRLPTGQSGPSSLAPRTLALRQRLKACLTAIHCSQEARLDDECAFYTSLKAPPGPARVCTNPVAMLLEWQDSMCFIPVGSMVPQGSPS